MPGAHKIGAAISGPRIVGRKLADMRQFFYRPPSSDVDWRVPNPPGANPLVAERAFPRVTIGVAGRLPGVQKK